MTISQLIVLLLDEQDAHGGHVAVVFEDFALGEMQVTGTRYEPGNGDELDRLILSSDEAAEYRGQD
jgi:hypothetical protein